VVWIRIRIQGSKNQPQERKSEEVSCFELLDVLLRGWRFLLYPESPSRRPKNKNKALLIKNLEFFINCKMFEYLVIKNLDLDSKPGS
jgi:hypothetical protein